MRAMFACAALALTLLCGSVSARDILIRGATVHTAGKQGTLKNTDVLVRDGKIAAVGTGLKAAADAETIDANGRALTPGLFGGLSAIGLEEVSGESATVDGSIGLGAPDGEQRWRPEFDVTLAYNPRSVLVPVARIEGLTWTVLTPGSPAKGSFVAGQGAAVSLSGSYDAVIDGSRSLFVNIGGDMLGLSGGSRAAQYMLLDQAAREARSPGPMGEDALLHQAGREVLKRYLAGGRVVFHVNRAVDIRQTLAFAKRNGFKPVISGGVEAWIVARELAEADVPVLLDALQDLPDNFDSIGARLDNAALLQKAGVRIALTQFGDSHNARKIRQLAGNAVAQGLSWDAALAALTTNPATIFGQGGKRGQIAAGQTADLVLWSGDPLEVTSLADQVWIAGTAIPMRSRQTELRDRYLERLKNSPAR